MKHFITQFAAFNYGFDNEGNALYAEKLHRTTNSEKYTYDALYQLANYKEGTLTAGNIPSPLTQTQYNYDGAGNRTTTVKDAATTAYTANNTNEYTAINTTNLIYDANGNITNDGMADYKYDFENRLISYTPPSVIKGVKYKYKYDAFGRRIGKMDGGSVMVKYYYDGYRVIEEQRKFSGGHGRNILPGGALGIKMANPAPIKDKLFSYIYGAGIDDILTMEQSSTQGINTYYYHTNALGSVVAVTNSTGSVAERYEYDAFGRVSIYNASYILLEYSAINNTYLFTGREYDAESGLYYYRTRHYNPQLGRFMQRDAIGIWGDIMNRGNGYGYVGNNPTNMIDPNGTYTGGCLNQPDGSITCGIRCADGRGYSYTCASGGGYTNAECEALASKPQYCGPNNRVNHPTNPDFTYEFNPVIAYEQASSHLISNARPQNVNERAFFRTDAFLYRTVPEIQGFRNSGKKKCWKPYPFLHSIIQL